jgi:hypothetical protein
MKNKFIKAATLSLFFGASLAANAQKLDVKDAENYILMDPVTDDNILLAKQAIDKASKHKTTENWYYMWMVRSMVYTRVFEARNHDMLSDQSAYAGYISAYSMMRFWKSDQEIKKADLEAGRYETFNAFGVGFNEAAEVTDKKLYDSAIQYYRILSFLHSKLDTANVNSLARQGITGKYLEERLAVIALYASSNTIKKEVLLELIDGGSKSPAVFENLSKVYLQEGDTVTAESVVRKGLAAAPGDNDMFNILVNFYISVNRVDDLFTDVNGQLDMNPSSRLFFIRGTLNERRDSFAAAIRDYRDAIELDEFNYDANYNLGIALINYETKGLYEKRVGSSGAARQQIEDQLKAVYLEARRYLDMASENINYGIEEQLNIYKALKRIALELEDKEAADAAQAKIDSLKEAQGAE